MDKKERFEIEAECQRLLVAFGRHRDDCDADGAASLLSEDSVWERDGSLIKGRDAIKTAIKAMPANVVLRHVFTNMKVDVIDSNNADGRAYYTVYGDRGDTKQGGGLPRPMRGAQRMGDYINKFVRTPEGWRISFSAARRVFSND